MTSESSHSANQRRPSEQIEPRRPSASTRPRLAALQSPASPTGNSPASPHTPRGSYLNRSISSAFNSPGNTFRTDDDIFVFEFGSRCMRAGLGGEARPRSVRDFGPSQQRRAGDYSHVLPNARRPKPRRVEDIKEWGIDHELWSLDIRDLDLGLVSDKIERAVRFALQDDLLIVDDTKRRMYNVVVPPTMPHPLLSTLMTTLFKHYPTPGTITLLSSPTMCTVSAGLRSALVVDIGWDETVVTAVYEYREIQHQRTVRAMKMLSWETRNMLLKATKELKPSENSHEISFEDAEEVLTRMMWCRPGATVEEDEEFLSKTIQVPLESSQPQCTLRIPFSEFATPVDNVLFGSHSNDQHYDDDEIPILMLMYLTLLALPVDVRHACLSRIIITGGGSNIPGIKKRLVTDLSKLVSDRGWDPVHSYGRANAPSDPEKRSSEALDEASRLSNKDTDPDSTTPAHLQPPLPDSVLEKIQERTKSQTRKNTDATQQAELEKREGTLKPFHSVSSLGAWAGASLMAGLRVRGVVEVEREKFLQNGLVGADDAKRRSGPPPLPQRKSLVATTGSSFNKAADRASGSWTLGAWA